MEGSIGPPTFFVTDRQKHDYLSCASQRARGATKKYNTATMYIPACFGVYSTKKLLALFSVTFGNICLPVGPTILHRLFVLCKYPG